MNVRLVALDIDGTLLDPGVAVDAVPDEAMSRAVVAVADAGITVVLASGRMFPGTARVARHLGVTQPLICQQGASVHDADGSLRHGHAIDEDVALDLLDYARTHDWPLAWFDSRRYLVTRHCQQAQFFAEVSQIDMEIHAEPHLSGVRATGIDIISSRERASLVHADIERRYGDRLSLLDFPSVTAVHAAAASKGNALAELAAELGIDSSEVLAIGDSVNDVSMLSWAGHSAAPAHCDAYARAAAGEILPGEGVAGVVARLRALVA
jgi:Cof subfamily protein (haloacid dehalogenase superfamily)